MGFLSSVGVMPANEVVSGGKIPNLQIQTLINNGILKNNETIELFYSEGFLSVAEGGQFLPPTKLVSYEKVDGKLEVYEMPYSAIASVETISKGHFFEDSVYLVNGNSYSNWESIYIILSIENNGDSRFIDKLEQNIANY